MPNILALIYSNIGVNQQAAPEPSHRTFRKRSRSRGQSIDRYLKLSAEQKCDIATRELEELREEIERMKESAEKKMQNFRVCLFSLSFLLMTEAFSILYKEFQ